MPNIEKLQRGQTPTLLHTSKGNEVINWLNVILNATIEPPEFGEIVVGDSGFVIQLNEDAMGGGGEWESKTIPHLGAPATQSFRVNGPPIPL